MQIYDNFLKCWTIKIGNKYFFEKRKKVLTNVSKKTKMKQNEIKGIYKNDRRTKINDNSCT